MSFPDHRAEAFAAELRCADGYIELGMMLDANDVIEHLDPDLKTTVEVLERREKIYAGLNKPELLAVVRNALARYYARRDE
ncbi:MAG: hypothetical protein INR69_19060 [Mucilaginibacter polytrichastri]|nr:hypothetical protein [Mucilaginibacter polytrichastri]